ncbi:MAG: hypothetical protein QM802_21135 [Agriterribacter sp.]
MKHILKSIAIAVVATSTLMGTAAAGISHPLPAVAFNKYNNTAASFNLKVNQLQNITSVHVIIEKVEGKRLLISLTGPDDATIEQFATHRKAGIIELNYNFQGAEEGTYTLQASDGKQKISKKIKISRSRPEVVTDMVIE